MAVIDQTPFKQAVGNNVTTVFPFDFLIIEKADLSVFLGGTLQVLDVDYTVSGEGVVTGGSVTFIVAPTADAVVMMIRTTRLTRSTDYQNLGDFDADVVDLDFDRAIVLLQDLNTQLARTIRVPANEVATLLQLPSVAERAGKLLRFNDQGEPEPALLVDITLTPITQSVIATLLYPQSAAEVAAAETPVSFINEYGSIPRYGAVGDGVAIDRPAAASAINVAEGSMRLVAGEPGDTYLLDGNLAPSGTLLLTMFGATFKATTAIDILTPKTRLDLFDGTFDTFNRGVSNLTAADPTLDLICFGQEFKNSAGSPISIECPTRFFAAVLGRYFDNDNYQVRHGKNDLALQTGWKSSLIAFNYFDGIAAPAASSVAAVISYALFARIIGNHARNILGVTGEDTAFYYTKSAFGMVLGNTGDILDTGVSVIMSGINLKGDFRSGVNATPAGYAASAIANNLRGSGKGNGIQQESDWQKTVACFLENFKIGQQIGSGDANGSMTVANHTYNTGVAVSLAVSADDIKGAKLIEALNVHHGAINGLKYGTQGANTLDRVLILGDHIEGKDNTGGIAIEITAATVGAITRVRITNAIIKSFSRGMELTGVYGAVITAPSFSDLATPTRPYFLTSCKNIRGRDAFNATLVTTDATATLVFDMGDLADGNLLKVTMHALAAKSDMSAVGSLRRDFTFKRNGATTSLVASGTLVNDGGSGLPADALSAAVSAHRAQFNVKGIAAETWNWTVNFDFELQ